MENAIVIQVLVELIVVRSKHANKITIVAIMESALTVSATAIRASMALIAPLEHCVQITALVKESATLQMQYACASQDSMDHHASQPSQHNVHLLAVDTESVIQIVNAHVIMDMSAMLAMLLLTCATANMDLAIQMEIVLFVSVRMAGKALSVTTSIPQPHIVHHSTNVQARAFALFVSTPRVFLDATASLDTELDEIVEWLSIQSAKMNAAGMVPVTIYQPVAGVTWDGLVKTVPNHDAH